MYMKSELLDITNLKHHFNEDDDWDVLNTWVFMITSFTTVGYGNHPSFVFQPPPCEYPGERSVQDNPSSLLLPPSIRQVTYGAEQGTTQFGNPEYGNEELPDVCFKAAGAPPPQCWVIADAENIFDFSTRLMYLLRCACMHPIHIQRS